MNKNHELEALVGFAIQFCRLVWGVVFLPDAKIKRRSDGYISVKADVWNRHVTASKSEHLLDHPFMHLLERSGLVIKEVGKRWAFWSRAVSADQLLAFLQGHDWQQRRPFLRYCLWRNLRTTFNLGQTTETIGCFHKLSNYLNDRTQGKLDVIPIEILADIKSTFGKSVHLCNAFIEICIHLQIIKPNFGNGRIVVEPRIDAEYLLSNVFGMPTSIPGFDQLFGGGGMILGECDVRNQRVRSAGRVIFIKGGFGAGKTTLALSLAAEVARKGGLAWFIPLEQSASDCEMCLATLNLCRDFDSDIRVIRQQQEIEHYLVNPDNDPRGHVIALATIEKNQVGSVMTDVSQLVSETQGGAELRLFVIDSFNCILDLGTQDPRELRASMVSQIRAITSTGANLLISGETELLGETNTNFVQNIADVVISLESSTSDEGYHQRYVRVEKSRLQREQRGAHAYSIKAGVGFDIYPSSAAISSKMRNRRLSSGTGETTFGWADLDELLGNTGKIRDAIQPGDVIAIEGDSGCLKTQLGMLFAMAHDNDSRKPLGRENDSPKTLILALGDRRNTINKMADSKAAWLADSPKSSNDLIIKEGLSVGYIQPGKVFQSIDEAFLSCVGHDYIDRVWIDNLWRWDWLCPFIQKDRTFGQTLVDYFRKLRVTSLFTCRDIDSDPGLQRVILDLANVRIRIQRVEYRGNMMLVVRVIKTRGMRHKTENFVLEFDGDQLRLSESGNMLRMDERGIHTIGTRLFLHNETKAQRDYNDFVVKTMEPLMGGGIRVVSENRTLSVSTDQLSELATVDELQLWQQDEFQVSTKRQECVSEFCESIDETVLDPQVAGRVKDERGLWAVPYFRNIGLLALDSNHSELNISSWSGLATIALGESRSDRLLFDFAKPSSETFVCLWIEMFISTLREQRGDQTTDSVLEAMYGYNTDDEELVRYVCNIFRTLCRPGYLKGADDASVSHDAIVSRQWFTTLGAFLQHARSRDHGSPGKRNFVVRGLPGHTSVAGDWYLSVPSYAAAPACARRIVDFMTSIDQQIYRLSSGVGLPVRQELLDARGVAVTGDTVIDVDLINRTYARVFRRSAIPNYRGICQQWSLCIKHLLEVATHEDDTISTLARSISTLLRATRHAQRSPAPSHKDVTM